MGILRRYVITPGGMMLADAHEIIERTVAAGVAVVALSEREIKM